MSRSTYFEPGTRVLLLTYTDVTQIIGPVERSAPGVHVVSHMTEDGAEVAADLEASTESIRHQRQLWPVEQVRECQGNERNLHTLTLPSVLRSSRRVLEVVNPEHAPEARAVEGVRLEPGWACLFLWENGGPWKQQGEPYRFDPATFVHPDADQGMALPYVTAETCTKGPTMTIKRKDRP